jgi:hypothetical protein
MQDAQEDQKIGKKNWLKAMSKYKLDVVGRRADIGEGTGGRVS